MHDKGKNQRTSDTWISLKGGEVFLTKTDRSTFQVIEGSMLVYILPLKEDGSMGRRYLLYEAKEEEILPSFYLKGNENGSYREESWTFGFIALDEAVLQEIPNSMCEALGEAFAKKARIADFGGEGYKERILEEYDRNLVKEENYIFATQAEREETKGRTLRQIYKLFNKDSLKQKTPESGSHIYDAFAYVCDRTNIPIAPYDKVVASSGRRFQQEDVARVSHFILREVMLENDWYKQDCGSMIAFLEDGHKAVALLPRGGGEYLAYHPGTKKKCRVDEAFSEMLEVKAYLLYRPFPNKEMTVREMFLFGLKESDTRDWIRFFILTLLGTLIGILLPMLNEQIYDKYIPMSFTMGVMQICMVLLACNAGNLSFTIVKNLSSFRGMTKMEHAVLAACCERLFNLPERFFRDYESADLSDRILKIDSLFQLISKVAVKTFVGALFSVLYLFQMNHYSSEMTKMGILMVAVVMLAIIVIAVCQIKYETEFLETCSKANSKMYQFLVGIQKIRMAGVEDRALYEYLKPYTKSKEITIHKERMTNIVTVLTASATNVFTVVMYYQMVKSALPISIGQFSAFLSAFGAFSAATLSVGGALLKLNGMKPMLDRVKPILSSLPEYTEDSELPGELTGDIEISNVDFAYEKDGEQVLKGISLHIRQGEYIGIVGSSGCGKSTLLKLLLGFETPDFGKIFYDAKDVDGMDKRELRKKLGVVLQDGKLIAGSIFENITISAPGATLWDAEQTAERVGLSEDIAKMPMGMHTVLSGTGGTISGGQMQRILIARAIVGNPKILFFDEATSALDNVTQAMVCESLAHLEATRLVIAHRLSTIQDCDRIIVLDKGRIVEEGNFAALMEKKGLFYDLASRQMA